MKHLATLGLLGATALASATPASAQSLFSFFDQGPATASTMTFRTEALRSDAYEIESSRIALSRSRDPRVRAFARGMIKDHQATTDALLPAGYSLNANGNVVKDEQDSPFSSPLGILTAPFTVPVNFIGQTFEGRGLIDNNKGRPGQRVALDQRRQAQLEQLASAPRGTFGATYTTQQVASHRDAVALYQGYATNGDLAEGRTFASQALPTLQHHLERATRLEDNYDVSEPAF